MSDVLLLLGGGILLYFGAEWLVGGAASLALSLRIPQVVIGLTVVAFARRELPVLILTTSCLPALLWDGRVEPWEGALLLIIAVAYTAVMVLRSRSAAVVAEATLEASVTAEAADAAGAPERNPSRARQATVATAGLAVLLVGGHLFVMAATSLARSWGMSERVVGLTVVAVGTSLPELVTSILAALRGHSDIAVGNVIGSNIFNVLLCLGASALAGRIAAEPAALVPDFVALGLATAMAAIFIRSARTMVRWEGTALLGLYVGFTGYLLFGTR
jgi:cation:H+ antiporter